MKRLLLLLLIPLTGCSYVSMMLAKHDSAEVSGWVDVKMSVAKAECGKPETWDLAMDKAAWLNHYVEFRNDPQKENVKAIVTNINKAAGASKAACERWLSLTNQRLDVLQKAWGTR